VLETHADAFAISDLSKALRAKMRIASDRAGEDEFVRVFEQALALGRCVAQQADTLDRLMGIKIESYALREVRERVLQSELSEPTLRALLGALDRQAFMPRVSSAFELERISMLDFIQRVHTDDGHGGGRFLPTELEKIGQSGFSGSQPPSKPMPASFNIVGFLYPDKSEFVDSTNRLIDAYKQVVDLPPAQRNARGFDPSAMVATFPEFNQRFLGIWPPMFGKLLLAEDDFRLVKSGTRTLLAIELYRCLHRRPPRSLDELVPDCLNAVPDDPFASSGPLRYLVLPEPDAYGRSYLLYSVGADGVDNGGKEARWPSESLLPQGSGTDFILNDQTSR
jgi:hypothetical protein